MKVEMTEKGARLIPETELEKLACTSLAKAGQVSVTCQDDWHQTGPIVLEIPRAWDQSQSGNS